MRALLDAGQGHSAAVMIAAFFGAVQSGRFSLAHAESAPLPFVVGGFAGLCGLYLFGWLTRTSAVGSVPKARNAMYALRLGSA